MAKKKEFLGGGFAVIASVMIIILIGLMSFNQYQISSIGALIASGPSSDSSNLEASRDGKLSLSGVDITQITSTAQGIDALFPLDSANTAQDVIEIMIPTGTPDYGESMGVSFEDPVGALGLMASSYPALKQQIQANEPEIWERYLSLAAAPRGISCEFCCGVGPQGITSSGSLKCGCKHNPAAQTVALWLMQNTDYSDAEILKEVYKWKTLFFPKNMVGLASQIAGGDTSVLQDLPGMVGGC